jgi:hypothetical protein
MSMSLSLFLSLSRDERIEYVLSLVRREEDNSHDSGDFSQSAARPARRRFFPLEQEVRMKLLVLVTPTSLSLRSSLERDSREGERNVRILVFTSHRIVIVPHPRSFTHLLVVEK